MAHGQGATSNRRGGYGPLDRGTRGHGADKAVKKAITRERDPRIQAALEETRKQQKELDDLIAYQKEHPAMGAADGAVYEAKRKEAEQAVKVAQKAQAQVQAEVTVKNVQKNLTIKTTPEPVEVKVKKFSTKSLKQTGEPLWLFAGIMGRRMVKAGYHIAYVIEFTGCGYEEFDDLPLDEDGYGMTEARLKAEEEEEDDDDLDP